MAGVEAGGAAAADNTADDEPATIRLRLGDVEILTAPWKSVASIQLAGAITPDSFVDTVEPGTVLAFKDRCSAPDKTVLALLRLLTYRLIDSSHA